MSTREYQAKIRESLSDLPGPALRPSTGDRAPSQSIQRDARRIPYILPVQGRLVRGMGEISDAGVHARGLTFRSAAHTSELQSLLRISYAVFCLKKKTHI